VVGRCGERVLVGATVDLLAHQLLWGGVGHRPNRHVGCGQSADVFDFAGDPEVRQQDTFIVVAIDGTA
jgi:hypothetical protein